MTIAGIRKDSVRLMGRLFADESGATAIEYGLLASLIAIAAIQSLELVGSELATTFSTVSQNMSTSADEAPPPSSDEAPPPVSDSVMA